ncbi:zinc finger, CCHC-type containing protein [Tanacetum coccineum]|uniref:Zinc finger, CCHC-type containing protein n=1 Tax=Tanacetum coccineum TaxID=301880 RepID=A0ABQ4X275_9ASTR
MRQFDLDVGRQLHRSWVIVTKIVAIDQEERASEKEGPLRRRGPPSRRGSPRRRGPSRKRAPNSTEAFHACKQEEGQSVITYVLKMKGYLEQMEHLGYPMPLVLGVNLILTSLSKDYDQFRRYTQESSNYPSYKARSYPETLTASSRHWRRNYPLYLAELRKNKAITSCTSVQGLRGIRKLNKGALDLYVGNGNRATDNGFLHKFTDYGAILVSKDNLFYSNAIPRDGIFEIDMHNHVSNEHFIYTCSNKKSKHNLDSTFLWHCRLGHINKKRIAKLQHDRLLKSIDYESFDVCVSCISGKMARKPFTHASERANDLLGLIHSDVCGPFRTTSREGLCSRVYLMVMIEGSRLKIRERLKAVDPFTLHYKRRPPHTELDG